LKLVVVVAVVVVVVDYGKLVIWNYVPVLKEEVVLDVFDFPLPCYYI
jgi:hypothetical protein